MMQQDNGAERVECTEIIYRALKKTWARDDTVAAEAFIRRVGQKETEDAISCFRRKYATARECRQKLTRMPAAASLHVGRVRDLPFGLEVSPDPDRDEQGRVIEPGHCLVLNLPDPVTDAEAAEFAASQLTRIARFITPDQEEREHLLRRGTA